MFTVHFMDGRTPSAGSPFLTILGSNPLPLVTLGLLVQPFLQRRKQEKKRIEKR